MKMTMKRQKQVLKELNMYCILAALLVKSFKKYTKNA